MRKSLILAAVSLAAAVMTAPIAVAHADDPSCAVAQLAFNRAQDALDDAVAADKAAADAKAADEELARAKSALSVADEELRVARADVAAKQARLDELTDGTPPDGTEDEIADAEAALKAAQEVQATAQSKATAAQVRVAAAEAAAKTDAAALQDIADKTDAAALEKTRDEARKTADRVCGGVTTTPPTPAPEEDLDCADFPLSSGRTAQQVLDETPGADPHGLDADGDRRACEPGQDTSEDGSDLGDDDGVVTPSGGVATGGGPA